MSCLSYDYASAGALAVSIEKLLHLSQACLGWLGMIHNTCSHNAGIQNTVSYSRGPCSLMLCATCTEQHSRASSGMKIFMPVL